MNPPQPNPEAFATLQYVNTKSQKEKLNKYAGTFIGVGATQIVLAIIALAFGAASLAYSRTRFEYFYDLNSYLSDWYDNRFSIIGAGIWSSLFFLVCGILAVNTGKKKSSSMNVGGMLMSIFTSFAAASLFGIELTGAITAGRRRTYSTYYKTPWTTSLALHCILAIVGLIEFVVAIVHSAYCCVAHSCCQPLPPATIAFVNQPVQGSLAPGQTSMVQVPVQLIQQPVAVSQLPVANMNTQKEALDSVPSQPNQDYPPAYQKLDNE